MRLVSILRLRPKLRNLLITLHVLFMFNYKWSLQILNIELDLIFSVSASWRNQQILGMNSGEQNWEEPTWLLHQWLTRASCHGDCWVGDMEHSYVTRPCFMHPCLSVMQTIVKTHWHHVLRIAHWLFRLLLFFIILFSVNFSWTLVKS